MIPDLGGNFQADVSTKPKIPNLILLLKFLFWLQHPTYVLQFLILSLHYCFL